MRHEFHDRGHPTCIAALASASTRCAEMHYEWKSTLSEMPVNGLYIMDEERSWWHFCLDDVLDLLHKYKPTRLIGSSMGGYGALLFAQLTGIPARALAPQTTISLNDWDDRYEQYLPLVRARTPRPDLLDLTVSGEQHHLHYCRNEWRDRVHAERVAVKLVAHECDSHKVAKSIKRSDIDL